MGAAAAAPTDPKTYEDAMKGPKAVLWKEAMQKEIINMETNST